MPRKDPDARREYERTRYLLRGSLVYCESRKRRRDALQEFYLAEKARPCNDCGGSFPAVAMDFDHVRGEKSYDVSKMVQLAFGLETIKFEIGKCDLVCANCHRVRTELRRRVATL